MSNIAKLVNVCDERLPDHPYCQEMEDLSYMAAMGSRAYGCHDASSDFDYYGFYVPPSIEIFPHQSGKFIQCFDANHVEMPTFVYKGKNRDGIDVDLQMFNIAKYVRLCVNGNPNVIDSLFVDDSNVLFIDNVGQMMLNNREMFLSRKLIGNSLKYAERQIKNLLTKEHKGLSTLIEFESCQGIPHTVDPTTLFYMAQIDNMDDRKSRMLIPGMFDLLRSYSDDFNKETLTMAVSRDESKTASALESLTDDEWKLYIGLTIDCMANSVRAIPVKIMGYDTKFAYHTYRLISQVNGLMRDRTLRIKDTNTIKVCKTIRSGDYTLAVVTQMLKDALQHAEDAFARFQMQDTVNEGEARDLLDTMLKMKYEERGMNYGKLKGIG